MSQTPFNPGKFEKVEQVDLVPAMQENYDRINEDLRVAYEGMRANDKRKIEAAKRQGDALVSLSQFSQKLTDFLVERQKEKNEEDQLAGIEMAYTEGLDPLTMQKFEEDEAEVSKIDGQIRKTAGAVEATGNVFAGQRIRELSGHKALGYAIGVASNAAANYPIWFAQEAQTATVRIGNKEVTLASADSIEERAAVMAAIRRKYLVQFNNVNPALLNKYLFEPMRRFEATENKAWGNQFADRLKLERKAEAEDEVYAKLQSNPESIGELAISFIDRYEGDYGSSGQARDGFFKILKELQQNGHIDESSINTLANYRFYHRGHGKEVAFGDKNVFGRQIETLRRQFEDTTTAEIGRRERQESARRITLQNEFEAAVAESHSRGERLPDAVVKDFEDRFLAGGLGSEPPTYLADYTTREEYDVEQEVERYKTIARAKGGYLEAADLAMVSSAAYEQLKPLIAKDAGAQGTNYKRATNIFTEELKEAGYLRTGSQDLNSNGLKALYGAQDLYVEMVQAFMAQNRTPAEAHNLAEQEVSELIKTQKLQRQVSQKSKVNQARIDTVNQQRDLLAKGEELTSGLNGQSAEDLEKATLDFARGRGRIPSIYTEMARGTNQLAHEIAEQAYRARTGKDLYDADTLAEANPETRELLAGTPTSGKANRIFTVDQQWGLDQIASVESEAYGGYTAFNQGGSNNGYTAYNPGDSAKGDHGHDRPITELTIGEIMARQKLPKGAPGALFAAGRYQFIPRTLAETFPDTGLSLDDKFDAAAQDRFAIARARWRLNLDNTNQGLINEWRGLKFLPAADLTRLRAILNNIPQSPYNQPENLRPGVAQALLR